MKISTNQQAIYTLSACGTENQFNKLYRLHEKERYLQACLYTHGKTRTALDWIYETVKKDADLARQRKANHLQGSAYAIGIALKKDETHRLYDVKFEDNVVLRLVEAIQSGNLTDETLICCILAIGCICDQRYADMSESKVFDKAFIAIRYIEYTYNILTVGKSAKAVEVALKMMNGEMLNADEEQFLLTKLER